jgi:hypothetical protein
VLIAAAVLGAVLLLGGGDEDSGSGGGDLETIELGGPAPGAPAATPFTISFPQTWSEVAKEELGNVPSDTLGVLRREGRSGLITVSQRKTPENLDVETLGARLGKQIKKGLPDAKEVAARPTHLPAGDAFVYSFVRQKAGTVHSVVIVPSGGVTYLLNTVIPSGDNKAAQEAGEIIRTLKFE